MELYCEQMKLQEEQQQKSQLKRESKAYIKIRVRILSHEHLAVLVTLTAVGRGGKVLYKVSCMMWLKT